MNRSNIKLSFSRIKEVLFNKLQRYRVFVLLYLLLLFVCFNLRCTILQFSIVKPISSDEVDAHGISLDLAHNLKHGDQAELVIDLFGEPADQQVGSVPGQVYWRYPIRAWNNMADKREIVPAPVLRINFDESGIITHWGFIDSYENQLTVREKLKDASVWFQSLSKSPLPIPPFIELSKILIIGQTKEYQVEMTLGQWHPETFGGPVPLVKKTKTASGSVWEWYVDRPSPMFIPPHYIIFTMDCKGKLLVWHIEQTYPGGRK